MRPARSRRVQAQRKFAQGAFVPPNSGSVAVANSERHDNPPDPSNVVLNAVSCTSLLDVISLQGVHQHMQPVVLIERLHRNNNRNGEIPSKKDNLSRREQRQALESNISSNKSRAKERYKIARSIKRLHAMSLRSKRHSKLLALTKKDSLRLTRKPNFTKRKLAEQPEKQLKPKKKCTDKDRRLESSEFSVDDNRPLTYFAKCSTPNTKNPLQSKQIQKNSAPPPEPVAGPSGLQNMPGIAGSSRSRYYSRHNIQRWMNDSAIPVPGAVVDEAPTTSKETPLDPTENTDDLMQPLIYPISSPSGTPEPCPASKWISLKHVLDAPKQELESRCNLCKPCERISKLITLSSRLKTQIDVMGEEYCQTKLKGNSDYHLPASSDSEDEHIYMELLPKHSRFVIQLKIHNAHGKELLSACLVHRSNVRTNVEKFMLQEKEHLLDQLNELMLRLYDGPNIDIHKRKCDTKSVISNKSKGARTQKDKATSRITRVRTRSFSEAVASEEAAPKKKAATRVRTKSFFNEISVEDEEAALYAAAVREKISLRKKAANRSWTRSFYEAIPMEDEATEDQEADMEEAVVREKATPKTKAATRGRSRSFFEAIDVEAMATGDEDTDKEEATVTEKVSPRKKAAIRARTKSLYGTVPLDDTSAREGPTDIVEEVGRGKTAVREKITPKKKASPGGRTRSSYDTIEKEDGTGREEETARKEAAIRENATPRKKLASRVSTRSFFEEIDMESAAFRDADVREKAAINGEDAVREKTSPKEKAASRVRARSFYAADNMDVVTAGQDDADRDQTDVREKATPRKKAVTRGRSRSFFEAASVETVAAGDKDTDKDEATEKASPSGKAAPRDVVVVREKAAPREKANSRDEVVVREKAGPRDDPLARERVGPREKAAARDDALTKERVAPKEKAPKDDAVGKEKASPRDEAITKERAAPKEKAAVRDDAVVREKASLRDDALTKEKAALREKPGTSRSFSEANKEVVVTLSRIDADKEAERLLATAQQERLMAEVEAQAKALEQERDAKDAKGNPIPTELEEANARDPLLAPYLVGDGKFPGPLDGARIVEAPVFKPTLEEIGDPIVFFERIWPVIHKFGLCKVIPPEGFDPKSTIPSDLRFDVVNQYISRLYNRWGPAAREFCAIKLCLLQQQNFKMTKLPVFDGVEVNLPKLNHLVRRLGGLEAVINKHRWSKVAEEMKCKQTNNMTERKLDQIYVKYLLPYDSLSIKERQKLQRTVQIAWNLKNQKLLDRAMNPLHRQKRLIGESESSSDESDDEPVNTALTDAEDCISSGSVMNLAKFKKVAAVVYRNIIDDQEVDGKKVSLTDVEELYWRHVLLGTDHLCVHTASVDTGEAGHGFIKSKNDPSGRHPWNLKNISQNPRNMLHFLGPVLGVTVPTLHLGMLFSSSCWHKDPHALAWFDYTHQGNGKIWYGIPDSQADYFRKAVESLTPTCCQNKGLWLPSDIVMIPPQLLRDHAVSLTRAVQNENEFIIVFPNAYTSSFCTEYTESESVYFAPQSWLADAPKVFQEARDSCEPTMFALEQFLLQLCADPTAEPEALKIVQPSLKLMVTTEIQNRRELQSRGIIVVNKAKGGKQRSVKWHLRECEECYYCRTTLYLSMVKGLLDRHTTLCLEHAIKLLNSEKYRDVNIKQLEMYIYVAAKYMESIVDDVAKRIAESKT